MKFVQTGIEGLVVVEPKVLGDERGFFLESYSARLFEEAGVPTHFVQDNFSRSSQGVLRGLHFQKAPKAQGKLVRVTLGSVYDVAVDLRKGSKTFGKYYGIEISAENKKSMYVPVGFAHGFAVLSEMADFQYKCTEYYAPECDSGIIWNDSDLKISWPVQNPKVSEKDAKLQTFKQYCELISKS